MRPVRTDDSDFTYKLQGGTEENDLPCRQEDGKVFSTWCVEDGELEEITRSNPRVVLSTIWPNQLGCSIKVGDSDVDTSPDAIPFTHEGQSCWQYWHTLTDHEEAILAAGAHIEVMVDSTPPPPIQVQFA